MCNSFVIVFTQTKKINLAFGIWRFAILLKLTKTNASTLRGKNKELDVCNGNRFFNHVKIRKIKKPHQMILSSDL